MAPPPKTPQSNTLFKYFQRTPKQNEANGGNGSASSSSTSMKNEDKDKLPTEQTPTSSSSMSFSLSRAPSISIMTTPKSSHTSSSSKKRRPSDSLSAGSASGSDRKEKKRLRAESPGIFDSEFKEGSIVWAKLEGFPWWTAMVRPEILGGEISRRKESEFHVQFFDDPPSRAWIRKIDLKVYEGSHDGKVPPSRFDPAWVSACKEADNALKISPKKRLEQFWIDFEIEGDDNDNDDEDMSEQEENQQVSTPKSKSSQDRDQKTKPRKRLKVIESSDETDEDEGNESKSKRDPSANGKTTKSHSSEKSKESTKRQDSGSDDEYEPSPKKMEEGSEASESDESMELEESAITTPDEESDIEMVCEKKSTSVKAKSNGKKSTESATPKTEVKKRLAQFTPGSSSGTPMLKLKSSAPEIEDAGGLTTEKNQNWPHLKYDFLQPNKIMDNYKRKLSDPEYDPGTLFVPRDFLDKQTPAMRQWWLLKSKNFDTVLFFKLGKFYEFYHMDAVTAAEELSIIYMKGDYCHAGFPESSYSYRASQLIEKGYKVARIEQTETPEMMTQRCSKIKGTKFDKVVKREICEIATRGVRYASFQDDTRSNPFAAESNFLYAISEDASSSSQPKFGVCFIDTTIGNFYIAQFTDDRHYSRLRTVMSHHSPAQILFERGKLSPPTLQLLNNYSAVRKESVSSQDFWDGKKLLTYLAEQDIFKNECDDIIWPDALKSVASPEDTIGITPHSDWELGLKSLGGVVAYLKHCLIDHDLLSLKKFSIYNPVDLLTAVPNEETPAEVELKTKIRPKFMVLDGITLRNLDITEGSKNLLSIVNRSNTHFGKRLLRQWVCLPLAIPAEISARLDAVEELMSLDELVEKLIPLLKNLPDLERLLSKVHYLGSAHRSKNHPEGRAIFFDEVKYSKNKIYDLINILKGFKTCTKIIDFMRNADPKLKSEQLCRLVDDYPELDSLLRHFDTAFDHAAAQKEGKIIPKDGVDDDYDEAKGTVATINEEANTYLKEIRKELGTTVIYFGNDKKRFQLEVPEKTRVPKHFEMSSSKKGFKRFTNETTREFVATILRAEAKREEVLRDITRRIFEKFDKHRETWKKAVDCIGELDALLSLTAYSSSQEDMSRPRVVYSETPYINIKDGRHPCMPPDAYIPNSCIIGQSPNTVETSYGSFVLLTGPNMGGKSTLMRQVGLIAVLSHIGCYVPAADCEMSVVDRIFTRLGANDNIGDGESTFFVEMSETGAILKHSTEDSLILMDELGRGTATYDGTAIAYAVSNKIVAKGSRTIFSTHYHTLVDSLENIPSVQLGHMACMVENENEEDPTQETITFLYKLSSGACPKSYGFNAARLAGIPDDVVRLAHRKAKEFEASVNKVDLFRKVAGGVKNLSLNGMKEMGVI